MHAFDQFSQVIAHRSRLREREADRAATASGSTAALASSLLRVGLATGHLRAAWAVLAERPDAAPHQRL